MTAIVDLLVANPLLLLFLIAAISYPLGRIKIKGTSLGVAAVLFVALAVNAINPNLKLPEVIYQLGAVLFVYTLGLSGGPSFFASFRGKGLRDKRVRHRDAGRRRRARRWPPTSCSISRRR